MKRAWRAGLAVVLTSGLVGSALAEDPPDAPKSAEDKPKPDAAKSDERITEARGLIHDRVAAKVPELVKAADADGNGEFTQEEFNALLQSSRQARAEIMKAVRAELGLPEREKRPEDERRRKKAAEAGGDEQDKAAHDEFVKKYDKDGDGKLSDEERQQARDEKKKAAEDERKARSAEAFAKADANGDGKVTADEATQFLTTAPKRKRPNP